MNVKELQSLGAIYFENIKTGLSVYQNEIRCMNCIQAYEFFKEKWQKEYPDKTFVDFYYFRQEETARQKVNELLTAEEKVYLEKLPKMVEGKSLEEEFIFPLEEELLQIVTKLNDREMLFSTIYFAGEKGKRSTWWGNYGKEYVVFWEKEEGSPCGHIPENVKTN